MGTRTDRRAEIKGRRGDEFVKKAEAGQRHASGTSKRQDEMKSNRRHPSRGESSLLVSSFSFLYSLPSCLRIFVAFTRSFARARVVPAVSSFFHPFTLGSFFSLSIRAPSRYFISVPTLTRCKRAKEAEKEARVRPASVRDGAANPLREKEKEENGKRRAASLSQFRRS